MADLKGLNAVLAWRDDRGGGLFWLTRDDEQYPALALRFSGDLADLHYFPRDGHAGFRCLGVDGPPKGGLTTLVYYGADPSTGEEAPNEFMVSCEIAHSIAEEFFSSGQMSEAVSWLEL